MAESRDWCQAWQPPPLPPQGSELFHRSFSYIRNNATHWENYKTFFCLCNLTLPILEGPTTAAERSTSTFTPMTSTVSQTTGIAVEETTDGPQTTTSTETHLINVKNDHVAVYIIIAIVIVAVVTCVALYIWFKVKKRRARYNIRSNVKNRKTSIFQGLLAPNPSQDIALDPPGALSGPLAPSEKNELNIYHEESVDQRSDCTFCAVCSLILIYNVREKANIASLPLKEYESTNYLDNKARNNQCWNNQMQEPCQSTDNDKDQGSHKILVQVEPISGTIIQERLMNQKNNSQTILVEAGYQNICFNNVNECKENECAKSPGIDSTSPLFDNDDGGLLPNVPQNDDSVPSEKKGNEYESFSVVIKSGQLPPIHGRSGNRDSVGSSPKKRRKRKTSLIKRTSEPVTNVNQICEDLVENRKSV